MASTLRSRTSLSLAFAMASALSVTLIGCGTAGATRGAAQGPNRSTAPSAVVTVADLPSAVHDVLIAPRTGPERHVRLSGVLSRQLEVAKGYFAVHATERGIAATTGALLLVREDDVGASLLSASATDALRATAHELSVRGDEGRSQALYNVLLASAAPDAVKAEAREHLTAIQAWIRQNDVGTGVANAGSLERIAIRRVLVEPSKAARDDAERTIGDWIKRAIALRTTYNRTHAVPPHEDAQEAFRALQTGPLVVAAIHLRDGDAAGAVTAIDALGGGEICPEGFYEALKSVAETGGAERWSDLLHRFESIALRGESHDGAFDIDHDVFVAATLGMSLELHRIDPANVEAALQIALALTDFQMAEASPAVLVEAVEGHTAEPRVVSAALAATMNAMSSAAAAAEPDVARRAYVAAAPILRVAEAKGLAGRLTPSPARVRELMGEIEVGQGRLEEAKGAFSSALNVEVSPAALLVLARIDAKERRFGEAKEKLQKALDLAKPSGETQALRGEILLRLGETALSSGDIPGAKSALASSVRELLTARSGKGTARSPHAERTLARVLDRLGAVEGADRALLRALSLTPHNKGELAQTLGLVIHRALIRSDVDAAQQALAQAVSAELDTDDLVYFALWVSFVEHEHKLPTSATCLQIFGRVADDARWVSTLSRFGERKITGAALLAKATTVVEKIEATFYAALEKRALGDLQSSSSDLDGVATGVGLDLAETALARELVHGTSGKELGPLPSDLVVP